MNEAVYDFLDEVSSHFPDVDLYHSFSACHFIPSFKTPTSIDLALHKSDSLIFKSVVCE